MTRRERLENKIQKRTEWAASAAARSESRLAAASRIADNIPFGQPILVGHHSERHARRDADRIRSNMAKGFEQADLSRHHESKAAGLARQLDESVFSDDADAIPALEARIAENEAKRDRMKRVNALYRKGDAAGLAAMGLDLDALRAKIAAIGLSFVKVPYEGYQLTNIGARIRADRERIATVKARQDRAAAAEASGGVSIQGDDWVTVTFAEKPDRAVLDALRAAGFLWRGGSWCGRRDALPACVTQTE